MGFLDKIKSLLGLQAAIPTSHAAPPPHDHHHGHDHAHDHEEAPSADDDEAFDLAGFNPDDEDAFFHAVLHMESDGQYGGTDESRAEIMQRFGIRDRSHWRTVKDSMYSALSRKHGSFEQASQNEQNWRQAQMQKMIQGNQAKAAASGEMNPVEGITLQAWAAINAAIVGGASTEGLLKGAGIDPARWARASAEWNARMSRDTTFAITTVYGAAFQAASQGKFGDLAREANAARAANRELALPPPMTHEQYWEIMYEQSYATKQGQDPVAALKACGLTIVDWTDLSTYMGYLFERTSRLKWPEYEAIHKRVEAKYAAKYPGVKADLDISF
jgi:hypothetical protein